MFYRRIKFISTLTSRPLTSSKSTSHHHLFSFQKLQKYSYQPILEYNHCHGFRTFLQGHKQVPHTPGCYYRNYGNICCQSASKVTLSHYFIIYEIPECYNSIYMAVIKHSSLKLQQEFYKIINITRTVIGT